MQNFGPYDDLELCAGTVDLCMVSGIDHTAMKIRQRLRTFQGEWWLDPSLGVPYYESILGQKTPDLQAIRGIYAATINATPGVKSLTSLTVGFDNASRTYTVEFTALDETGTTISEAVVI